MLKLEKSREINAALILYTIILVVYQIYFFCLLNVITYSNYSIILSLHENIFYISCNLGVITLISAFIYLSFSQNYRQSSDNRYYGNNYILITSLIIVIGWISYAIFCAMSDIKLNNHLKNWYEYFLMFSPYICCLIIPLLYSSFMSVVNPKRQSVITLNQPQVLHIKFIILHLCAFVIYQVFFFCIINIMVYSHLEVTLTITENISYLLLNIFFNVSILSFFYFIYYYKNSISKKEIFNKMKYWIYLISIVITFITRALIFAIHDVYSHTSLGDASYYLWVSYKEVIVIAGAMAWSIYDEKLH